MFFCSLAEAHRTKGQNCENNRTEYAFVMAQNLPATLLGPRLRPNSHYQFPRTECSQTFSMASRVSFWLSPLLSINNPQQIKKIIRKFIYFHTFNDAIMITFVYQITHVGGSWGRECIRGSQPFRLVAVTPDIMLPHICVFYFATSCTVSSVLD